MKNTNTIRSIIDCVIIMLGVFLIVHRRVFSALITGGEMPEAPEWHKKWFCCGKGE
ncbi:MAG: hypothetical protein K6C13_15945 [Oscillospiraceae bacterium]|nr:hypothetical protein [Oscillospiraceae bacterium]